jgi:hypothetical protein
MHVILLRNELRVPESLALLAESWIGHAINNMGW